VKNLGKLSLRYYFFDEMQEKDFFDKKEKINRRLNKNYTLFLIIKKALRILELNLISIFYSLRFLFDYL